MCDDYNENIENPENPFRDPENYRNLFEFTRNLSLNEHNHGGTGRKTQEKNMNNNNAGGQHKKRHFLKEEIQGGGGIEKYSGPPNVAPSLHQHNQMKTIATSQKSFRTRNSSRMTAPPPEEPR